MAKSKSNFKKANKEAKKALKWIILSGAALTALNGLSASLLSLEKGEIDLRMFIAGLFFTISYAVINTLIYWIHEYNNKSV